MHSLSKIQAEPRPLGSQPKSDWKTELSSCSDRMNCPGAFSVHSGTSGHTLTFGHLVTIFFAQASHSKTEPLLPEVSSDVAEPKRIILLPPIPTPAKISRYRSEISLREENHPLLE